MTSSKTPTQSDVLVTSCPQCNAVVGLPSLVSIDASLRCPLCGFRYRLRNHLPASLPQLEIVMEQEEPGTDEDEAVSTNPESVLVNPTEKLDVSEVLRKGAKRRHRRHYRVSTPQSNGQPASEQFVSTAADVARIHEQQSTAKRSPSRRHTSASKRKLIEFLKIALGGLLALPVAQLIIWWGLGIDPLQFGPAIGKVVPFVVPEKIREASPLPGE